jgi:hypothetical protein
MTENAVARDFPINQLRMKRNAPLWLAGCSTQDHIETSEPT